MVTFTPSNITTTLVVGDTLKCQFKGSTNGNIAGGMVIKLST